MMSFSRTFNAAANSDDFSKAARRAKADLAFSHTLLHSPLGAERRKGEQNTQTRIAGQFGHDIV
jgi:hypothetical protein